MNKLKTNNMQEIFRRVYIELLFFLLPSKEDINGFQLSSEIKAMSKV